MGQGLVFGLGRSQVWGTAPVREAEAEGAIWGSKGATLMSGGRLSSGCSGHYGNSGGGWANFEQHLYGLVCSDAVRLEAVGDGARAVGRFPCRPPQWEDHFNN